MKLLNIASEKNKFKPLASKMPHILYLSTLCSEKMNDYLFTTAVKKPIQSAQKFHRLIVKGMVSNGKKNVNVISAIPVIPSRHKRLFWFVKDEEVNGVNYSYLPFLNVRLIKNITVFISCFFKVFFWCLKRLGKKRVLITDVLNLTTTAAAVLACKITFTKNIGIVTDMPNLLVSAKDDNKKDLKNQFNFFLINQLKGLVLLTEQMNEVINHKKRPFIIMEGLVDSDMNQSTNKLSSKNPKQIILYAGGLYEKYGIKKLIDGFRMLTNQQVQLHLYGVGPMVEEIEAFARKDSRIIYKGMVANEVVVDAQLKATLLVNPRSSKEEFTKYSFPSKNMEYMASGTPVLTTPLPGMPKEYYDFVYILDHEDESGIFIKLEKILANTPELLHDFGLRAKEFVLSEKNNNKQAARITELAEEL